MTKSDFAKCMAILEAGTGKPLKQEQLAVWFDCLGDLSAEQLATAVKRYLMEDGEWPSIAKLRKLATEAQHGQDAGAGELWGAVVKAIRCYGIYQPDEAKRALSPLAWDCVRACGGWMTLCEMEAANHGVYEAMFRRSHATYAAEDSQRRLLPADLVPVKRLPGVNPACKALASSLPAID